ncbi:bifunctional pyr operon transcriptional regulator/uracil phosphoribosyltransferase PyrR [Caldicellulosiruptor sp. F32]|uniref:bifunctional pyr operon transcriptional regulator/uracil phosphoribosyltransferase PyrR n=1 Tax=Caldicellulosiruptor sp. F32 TaxID=1214564 RepID=UPI0003A1DFDD|nr:bifunctional pyr operon transcriptional regulator/uracil phosphoribosyltransferase PyrR [Caldicellulosiruptor sp. F32]
MEKFKEIMDSGQMNRALIRISHEILEKNKGVENLCLVGIQRRGVTLAKRIRDNIEKIEGVRLPLGILDITFYRDDLSLLSEHPTVNSTQIDFDINNKKIVLVDDVLFTGRTARAAIEALMDMGRPKMIQLAVLIDRGHRELPIRADYVGKNVPTSRREIVHVLVDEFDNDNRVIIEQLDKEI